MLYKFIYSRILKIDFIFNFNENPSSGLGTYMNIFPFRKEWECWNALISTFIPPQGRKGKKMKEFIHL